MRFPHLFWFLGANALSCSCCQKATPPTSAVVPQLWPRSDGAPLLFILMSKKFMEAEPMLGKRVVKPKRNENFAYDEDSLRFLSTRSSSGSNLRHTSLDSNNLSVENSNVNNVTAAESITNPWFNLVYLNSFLPSHSRSSSSSVRFNVGDTSALAEGSRSLSQSQNTQGVDLSTDDSDLYGWC